jgi:hypothetical protein
LFLKLIDIEIDLGIRRKVILPVIEGNDRFAAQGIAHPPERGVEVAVDLGLRKVRPEFQGDLLLADPLSVQQEVEQPPRAHRAPGAVRQNGCRSAGWCAVFNPETFKTTGASLSPLASGLRSDHRHPVRGLRARSSSDCA